MNYKPGQWRLAGGPVGRPEAVSERQWNALFGELYEDTT